MRLVDEGHKRSVERMKPFGWIWKVPLVHSLQPHSCDADAVGRKTCKEHSEAPFTVGKRAVADHRVHRVKRATGIQKCSAEIGRDPHRSLVGRTRGGTLRDSQSSNAAAATQ